MTGPGLIDAHAHLGLPGQFFIPDGRCEEMIQRMDALGFVRAICCGDMVDIAEGPQEGLATLRRLYEQTRGRTPYLGVFDPRDADRSLRILKDAARQEGFVGIKLHPSFHRTAADDPVYRRAWEFAAEHDVAIMSHSWSPSDYNPAQSLSTPRMFQRHVEEFPQVRFVLGHAGGRGSGRLEAVRLAGQFPNVFVDIAGDIFCFELIESLVRSVGAHKVLFGSDWPWFDLRSRLCQVLLAEVDEPAKEKILRGNALTVYKLGSPNAR